MMITENDPAINPQGVGYMDDIQREYSEALLKVNSIEDFEVFKKEWDYWLDDSTKLLKEDWGKLKSLIDDCRKDKGKYTKKHKKVLMLLVPSRLLEVSIVATKFGVPWGCAYIQMRQAKVINY